MAGIFEVFEISGQDLTLAASSYLMPYLNNSSEPSQVLRDRVERGELGVKTGKGFYDWTPETADALRQRIAHALVERGPQPCGRCRKLRRLGLLTPPMT